MTVFSPSSSVFALSLPFHQRSLLGFTYMLLLPEGQTGEAWELSKKQCSSVNREAVARHALKLLSSLLSRAVGQAVSRRALTAQDQVRSQLSPREICGRKSGTRTGFSPSTSGFPCQHHSTNAPYSFMYCESHTQS